MPKEIPISTSVPVEVVLDDGKVVTMHMPIMPPENDMVVTPIALSTGDFQPNVQGLPPLLKRTPKRKIKMYRGYTMSLVPIERFQQLLGKGFTTQPTRKAPEAKFACGIETSEGLCPKKLLTEVDRLNHIVAFHKDLAAWVLNDDERRKMRGELGIGSQAPVIVDLQAQIDAAVEKRLAEIKQSDK